MACATLKRSLDWEIINQRPNKRRRCSPYGHSSSSVHQQSSCPKVLHEPVPSIFVDCTNLKLTPEIMAENIREQITRINRRKQLIFPNGIERMQDSESSGSEMGPDSPRRPDSPSAINRNSEKGLFTFKQVQLICERMLKEREETIRQEYETVLTNKLAEQYDAFVKFTHDQIQRRFEGEAAPSYLS